MLSYFKKYREEGFTKSKNLAKKCCTSNECWTHLFNKMSCDYEFFEKNNEEHENQSSK